MDPTTEILESEDGSPSEVVGAHAPGARAVKTYRQPNRLVRLWRSIGGGSLTLSILFHVGLVVAAGFIVFASKVYEKQIDFLPGGGTQQGAKASAELAHKVQVKRQQKVQKSMPQQRLISTSIDAALTLPEAPPAMLDMPDFSSLAGGDKLGSTGFGTAGAGGGFGSGVGMGAMSGRAFKPLMMFGKELKDTRKIAVVMDVSRSMTKFLPLVAKELDKVAYGSPLVLYFGCGLVKPKEKIDDDINPVSSDKFRTFWQVWEGKTPLKISKEERKKLKYDPAKPMPLEAIYDMMSQRRNTWFVEFNGITYAWTALMSKEVMEADTIYWFADFMDKVESEQMEAVLKTLKKRKQKLYIHASREGRSFAQVRDELVIPSGGEVIQTQSEEPPKKKEKDKIAAQ
ncbi:hypothetical protein [Prosthecobacter vanneervenii]|uniref:Uncharacterized protein n=1 Tax=Prosthecobacter vanneervenii TaxID=48466 RepID=A0A7W8DMG6_9BACT|nr:hypothetical protein [Prosthecobacter vanneervenii]MBB5034926.1 hypothetical protein [Prosthecobacter vanneervenii]